jgi:polyisoprenyl-phosphate glycosyltransferase
MSGEIARFIVVGLTTVGVDYACYMSLLWLGLSITPAKGAGFICGAIFAFYANRAVTFRALGRRHAPLWFAIVYLTSLISNVAVNKVVLLALPQAILLAFLIATGVSATINFIGMKYLVFTKPGMDA